MQKLFSILFIFFISLGCFAQKYEIYEGDTINKVDEKKLKQGLWIYFNEDYFGNIYQKGTYLDNKKVGLWESFYPNGKPYTKITYKNNKQYGEVSIYYKNGNLQEQGYWKINRWVGEYKYCYENGVVKYHWFFDEEGKRTGTQTYFHENGEKQVVGTWMQGKESGTVKEYYATGQVKKETNFNNGTINGSVTEYYADGQIMSKSIFVNGQVDQTQSFAYQPDKSENDTNNNNNENSNSNDNQNGETEYKTFTGTGYYKFVNDQGKVEREGNFVNGILINGKRYVYDHDGTKIKTAIIEDGRTIQIIDETKNNEN